MCELEDQIIELDSLISSTEDWSTEYGKDPKTHAKLIKLQSKFELQLRRFFRNMSRKSHDFIYWSSYNAQLNGQMKADYNVDVIVNDNAINESNGEFIKITFETVKELIITGMVTGETVYKIPIGVNSTSANIQALTMDKVASLVGKKVLKDGSIVNNPRPEYNIIETVRNDIAQSIKTSLGLGETLQEATVRIQKVIDNPSRSETIARTESINAYQQGLKQFAVDSQAVGKEWQTVNGCEICQGNVKDGAIPINSKFSSGNTEPGAHVRCKCGIRYIYQEEWNNLKH